MEYEIRQLRPSDESEWLRLRMRLWDWSDEGEQQLDMARVLKRPDVMVVVAARPGGGLAGFAEIGERSIADGCDSSPVGYLEAWYVDADARGQGVGAALVGAGEHWARERGCTEFASDALLSNEAGQRAHEALGFEVVDRVVNYRKSL